MHSESEIADMVEEIWKIVEAHPGAESGVVVRKIAIMILSSVKAERRVFSEYLEGLSE